MRRGGKYIKARRAARRLAVVAVGLTITSLLIGAGGSAARPTTTAKPTGPTVPWGFNEDWGWPAQGAWSSSLTTRHLKLAGAIMPDSLSANRFHVQWAKVESTPGTYNWTETDGQYAAMRKYTARPVMLLFNAPHWARDPGATCPSSLPCAYPPLTQYDSDWSQFVQGRGRPLSGGSCDRGLERAQPRALLGAGARPGSLRRSPEARSRGRHLRRRHGPGLDRRANSGRQRGDHDGRR